MAADRNVSGGGCGYDGTCTEDGLVETIGRTYLLLFLATIAVGLSVAWLRSRRSSTQLDRWWGSPALRHPVCFTAVLAGSLSLIWAAQVGVVTHLVNPDGSTTLAGQVAAWNSHVAMADSIVLAVLCLTLFLMRPHAQAEAELPIR